MTYVQFMPRNQTLATIDELVWYSVTVQPMLSKQKSIKIKQSLLKVKTIIRILE